MTLFANVAFKPLQPNKIAILHHSDYWIRRLVLNGAGATTISVYPETSVIHIRLGILWRALICAIRLKFWLTLNCGLKATLRKLYDCYLISLLDYIGAEVVLTHVDNSHVFQRLSRADPRRSYFAIQNGVRTLTCVRDGLPSHIEEISMTNFFCFSRRDVDLFTKHGHKIDRYLPVGSMVGAAYRSFYPDVNNVPKYDLCLVSQWHDHFYHEIVGDEFPQRLARRTRAALDAMNQFLVRLLSETGLTMAICARDAGAEQEFYKTLFGEKVVFPPVDLRNFSTYRTADKSRLVIGLHSTVLSEVFSWGHKVLWCNATEDEYFEMPEASLSYFHGDDYALFKHRVLNILDMPQSIYEAETFENAQYINTINPSLSPHEMINKKIAETLILSSK